MRYLYQRDCHLVHVSIGIMKDFGQMQNLVLLITIMDRSGAPVTPGHFSLDTPSLAR